MFNQESIVALVLWFAITCTQCHPINKTANAKPEQIRPDDDSTKLALYNMFGGGNPSRTPDGMKLVEGDIVVRGEDLNNSIEQRKATPDSSVYWPNGEVVYTYHESIKPNEMMIIEEAMQHWSQHTCITFRQRQAGDYLFVRFRSDTQGCWSLVGRQADRFGQGQDVSIGLGCANFNVVVHEIGHVIGFYHEQSRSDRDQYIDIVWANVMSGYALQFRKESDSNYDIPYDLTSTMQYPQWAFSKEIFEKSTIVARNPAYQRFLIKSYPLSFRDRKLANIIYQCSTSCTGSCSNGGYMRSTGRSNFGASSCTCDCPPNFTGAQCEQQVRADYYEDLPCGGIVTKPGTIETPGFPQRTAPFQSCMWDIRAPQGKRISIKINGFEIAPRFTKLGTKVINKCLNESVEVRLKNDNIYDGDVYCGTDLSPGQVFQSDGPRAVIVITANDKMIGSGMSAKVKFLGSKPGEQDEEGDDEQVGGGQQEVSTTPRVPFTSAIRTTERPPIFTQPASTIMPTFGTLPPQPPPINVVTTSSLLEEYEKESKKTLPPVIPYFDENQV